MDGLGTFLRRFFAHLARDASGNALAIFAGALLPLTAMIGGGVDMGIGYMAQAKLQNACDAGVLAARQTMVGNTYKIEDGIQGQKFFAFNFPDGIYGIQDATLRIKQDDDDRSQLLGFASAHVPTSIMIVFGYDEIPISAACNARRDMGYNDVMLVLDVTGSMNEKPSKGGGTKIARLRTGAVGLYRSLAAADTPETTRFGIVPYNVTSNVGRLLKNSDFLTDQPYYTCTASFFGYCLRAEVRSLNIKDSRWRTNNSVQDSLTTFRNSGSACVEERPSDGYTQSNFQITTAVNRRDVDRRASNSNDTALQFGRYDDSSNASYVRGYCPAEATRLKSYANEDAFSSAIKTATDSVNGNTYHDAGMMWGLRLISPTGFFAADNPLTRNGVVVNQHIVFMTDGEMVNNDNDYSYASIESVFDRVRGKGDLRQQHLDRFMSICEQAKAMRITVWVIALDVKKQYHNEIAPCASEPENFYVSNGEDLENVFSEIGAGIGRLRLTR